MTHKLIIPISLLALVKTNLAFAQSDEVRFLIDTSISIMKNNAVNAAGVNWDTLTKNAMTKAKGMNSPYELGPVMRYLYKSINDFHGAFFYRDSTFKWQRSDTKV